mmetsp:Transcript_26593/g.62465  ORF Transcript_26593/g.62465 Transcript_26593/m.62465 type:complete len:168 (-) Transcript_26593:138-641(-)
MRFGFFLGTRKERPFNELANKNSTTTTTIYTNQSVGNNGEPSSPLDAATTKRQPTTMLGMTRSWNVLRFPQNGNAKTAESVEKVASPDVSSPLLAIEDSSSQVVAVRSRITIETTASPLPTVWQRSSRWHRLEGTSRTFPLYGMTHFVGLRYQYCWHDMPSPRTAVA